MKKAFAQESDSAFKTHKEVCTANRKLTFSQESIGPNPKNQGGCTQAKNRDGKVEWES